MSEKERESESESERKRTESRDFRRREKDGKRLDDALCFGEGKKKRELFVWRLRRECDSTDV